MYNILLYFIILYDIIHIKYDKKIKEKMLCQRQLCSTIKLMLF